MKLLLSDTICVFVWVVFGLSLLHVASSFGAEHVPSFKQQRRPTSSELAVGSSLAPPTTTTLAFFEEGEGAKYSASLDEELWWLAQISDDSQRRAEFESFVRIELMGRRGIKVGSASYVYKLGDLINDGLIRLGHSIQDQSWKKYVVSGFQEDAAVLEDKQLWACVDMLIQLKAMVETLGGDGDKKKAKGNCGKCKVCSCGKQKKVPGLKP